MKKTQSEIIASFMERFSIPLNDARALYKMRMVFAKSANLLLKNLPKRLHPCFAWLIVDDMENNFPDKNYPIKELMGKSKKTLYKVVSFACKFRHGKKMIKEGSIEWIYGNERKRPLVNYWDSVLDLGTLNHAGVKELCENLDALFSKEEATSVKEYLDRVYGKNMKTSIIRIKLPNNSTDIDSAAMLNYGGINHVVIDLDKDKEYTLPFKVQGFYLSEKIAKAT